MSGDTTMSETTAVRWFAELGIGDRVSVGGKGASLGELTRAGASVPPGFVVTTAAFERFLRTFDADGHIRAAIRSLDAYDSAAVRETSARLRAELEAADLPADVLAEIADAHSKLAANAVAVRSSGSSEDQADASFAGLQDTFLWVKGLDAVVTALKRCWSSLYSVESVTYRLRLHLPEAHVAMAVVVQAMVDARTAGVMFTRSPVSGDKSVIAIEAAWGLGSAVVSGEVTPDKFVVNKITGEIVARTISVKHVEHLPDMAAGEVREAEVPAERQAAPSVSDAELRALVATGKAIEKHYCQPMDIEWAIDRAGNVMLLQARPETVWSQKQAAAPKPIVEPKADPLAHVLRALSVRG
jgi:pyruvate,water dikinase